MMFHLAACSFPKASDHNFKQQHLGHNHPTLLDVHQTHKLLKQWDANHYRTTLPNQKITFTNKHPYAKNIHKIISGYTISSFTKRNKGIGLPVVVQTDKNKFKIVSDKAYQTNVYPGTLVVTRKASGSLHITLLDPRIQKRLYKHDIATQRNIVIDYIYDDPLNRSLSIKGLLNPLSYQHIQGFYLSRPYDKNRIPIVMIHGIFSSPETFMDMAETIESQPDLYQKYQIWHYYYPTGTPWLATAHDFRKSYRDLVKKLDPQQANPNINKTIIIAHSMGGLISRLSLSDPKNTLKQAYLGDHGSTLLTPDQHRKLDPYFHYKPLTQPQQIIFLGVPHRGSRLAKGIVGWTMDKLIAIPNILIKGTQKVLLPQQKSNLPKHTQRLLTNGENAVNQLQPNNPALKALNQMQLPKRLKVHSIIGDIGLPLIRLNTDGVVSYPSAHITGRPETIIPSNHDITDAHKAIKQVLSILREKLP